MEFQDPAPFQGPGVAPQGAIQGAVPVGFVLNQFLVIPGEVDRQRVALVAASAAVQASFALAMKTSLF